MKVILLEDISKGKAGDVVELKDGFVRNFLLPKNKAILATKENLKKIEIIKKRKKIEEERALKEKEALKGAIESLVLTIKKKTGEDNRIFGEVTSSHIKDALLEKNIDIDKRDIELPEQGIKSLGEYMVKIKLGPIKASCKVLVEPE